MKNNIFKGDKITIVLDYNKNNEGIINELINNENIIINNKDSIDLEIIKILTRLGMPANLHGHQYIKEAIKMGISNHDNYLHPYIKLYPRLSELFNVKDYMIEKSMRDAITITWSRGNFDYQNKLFGYTIDRSKGKPTNGEFIAQIVNYLNAI